MRDVLPALVIDRLRDRYLAGVADAEAQFHQHEADEDSVTGALAQAISMRPLTIRVDGSDYTVSVDYRKVRGRGPGAPERVYGTDGVFQITVETVGGEILRRKALPFQAKKQWTGKNAALAEQAQVMSKTVPGGLVVDYSPSAYTGCRSELVVEMNGDRRKLDAAGMVRPLGQVLANDFLNCDIGTVGLFFDAEDESFRIETPGVDVHLLTTGVIVERLL